MFKVGDMIKGTNRKYIITNHGMLKAEVVTVYKEKEEIKIRVLKHVDKQYHGQEFIVDNSELDFELYGEFSMKEEDLTMENLERCFMKAIADKTPYIGVEVRMQNFPSDEIIINDYENLSKKLEYYKKAYNDNLTLKAFSGIRIVGFGSGNSFEEIEFALRG